METSLFIHVGLPKTGTTFMQEKVFKTWQGVNYLGRPFHFSRLFKLNQVFFPISIISSENILGKLGEDIFSSAPEHSYRSSNFLAIKNLATIFPNAKIILSLCRQDTFVESIYKQYLRNGGNLSISGLYTPNSQSGILHDEDLEFIPLIECIIQNFQTPPFVFLREEIATDLDGLMEDLAHFIGTSTVPQVNNRRPLNAGVMSLEGDFLRYLNGSSLIVRFLKVRAVHLFFKIFGLTGSTYEIASLLRNFGRQTPIKIPEPHKLAMRDEFCSDWSAVLEYVRTTRGRDCEKFAFEKIQNHRQEHSETDALI